MKLAHVYDVSARAASSAFPVVFMRMYWRSACDCARHDEVRSVRWSRPFVSLSVCVAAPSERTFHVPGYDGAPMCRLRLVAPHRSRL